MKTNTQEEKKQNLWNRFMIKFFNDHGYSTRRKFYNSIWSIIFALLVLIIVISFFGYNPFSVLLNYFKDANDSNNFIPTIAVFVFASLAVAISFKSGIFNIGIPGQMMISGIVTLYILRSAILKNDSINYFDIFLSLLLSIILSVVSSLIIGFLKAYLNINEVVSSIMLNWIIFFLIWFIVKSNADGFLATSASISQGKTESYGSKIPEFFNIPFGSWYESSYAWLIIIFTIVVVLIIWSIIKFTKFGYKIKMIGLSQTASDYSGTNKKWLIISVMTISGILSAIAGFIWYFSTQNGIINISKSSGPLIVGFNAIAVSLIVFDNPLGIIFSSILFSIIQEGTTYNYNFPNLPSQMVDIIAGIFIYSAALAFIFSKFLPYQWIKNFIVLIRYKKYRENYWKNWREHFMYSILFFKEKKELFVLYKNNKKEWNKINKDIKLKEKKEQKKLMKNKFNFSALSNDQQIEYLNYLSLLKKEKDLLLSKAHFFDKNQIKNYRRERLINWKQSFSMIKKTILNEHYKIDDEKLYDSTKEIEAKEQERINQKTKGGKK